MYEVTTHRWFSGGHFIRQYGGACERLHGHNWKVEVTLSGESLGPGGMLYDFRDLKKALDAVLEQLDHTMLNEVAPFDAIEPSAENIAFFVAKRLAGDLAEAVAPAIQDIGVRVWETESSSATFRASLTDLAGPRSGSGESRSVP
jgi:6-pyruvoyltetrahydropterin/6-carboxytetrahydropterin synthase